jgi:hypothetical protein
MFDLDGIAYAMLGLSLSASAVQLGRWLLHTDPRAIIIKAGRWSLAGVIGLAPVVLVWLVISGRSTVAMMLAISVRRGRPWSTPRPRTSGR